MSTSQKQDGDCLTSEITVGGNLPPSFIGGRSSQEQILLDNKETHYVSSRGEIPTHSPLEANFLFVSIFIYCHNTLFDWILLP